MMLKYLGQYRRVTLQETGGSRLALLPLRDSVERALVLTIILVVVMIKA